LEELEAKPDNEKLRRYKSNWLRHVTRMNNNGRTNIMLNYRLTKWTNTTWKTSEERSRHVYQGLTGDG